MYFALALPYLIITEPLDHFISVYNKLRILKASAMLEVELLEDIKVSNKSIYFQR